MSSREKYFPRSLVAPRHGKVLRVHPSSWIPVIRVFPMYNLRFRRLVERYIFPNRKRKALLIGIKKAKGEDTLARPHEDVYGMRDLLIDVYGYRTADIKIMLDDGVLEDTNMLPTHKNILREIGGLIRGAQAGDRFVFHFSGHSTQVENVSGTEDDGMDEAIIPVDSEEIIDNALRKNLVDPLPAGSHLVAIFDTCHSASLLDLSHHRCNRLTRPGEGVPVQGNRAEPQMRVPWTPVQAKLSVYQDEVRYPTTRSARTPTSPLVPKPARSVSINQPQIPSPYTLSGPTPSTLPLIEQFRQLGLPITMNTPAPDSKVDEAERQVRWLTDDNDKDTMRATSPERYSGSRSVVCDGGMLCEAARAAANTHLANVIALGACKDGQTTWEDQDAGKTMTAVLVEHLANNPLMPLEDLMRAISEETYNNINKMHRDWEAYKKRAPTDAASQPDFSKEWQDPQLAGHWKLDLSMPFLM
ncbi:hypothetical protein FIBSPDRAFT_1048961 [Athelia psychrophila]|uniref:Peptidase C14 caspase domain-containing protein n=1 Tax=Athelia psychrophila TaxID=1759441 RepID=A0A166D1D7_9AGAM|nr:hypothetical protein FIBSPDRAFT_1048961 [Fibularhizoctonia sp. CBS 109695]